MSEQRLTFNNNYYPTIQNVKSIVKELHILSTPNIEQKKVFPNLIVIWFWNGKSLKITSLEKHFPNLMKVKGVNYVGNKLAWSVIL